MIAIIIIAVAAAAHAKAYVTSIPILAGLVACGVFLLIIALLGIVGTAKLSQAAIFMVMWLL